MHVGFSEFTEGFVVSQVFVPLGGVVDGAFDASTEDEQRLLQSEEMDGDGRGEVSFQRV